MSALRSGCGFAALRPSFGPALRRDKFRLGPLGSSLPWLPVAVLACCAAVGQEAALIAPARLRVERAADTPWPANVGAVEVWPTLMSAGKFSVATADGKPVQAQTVWTASGEPALIRFNTTSRATTYYFSFDTNAVPAPGPWQPEAGVLLETRSCLEQPINTREQVNRLVNASGPVYGRSLVPQIFLGRNPQGPSAYYVALFSGWFNAPQAGEYAFATVSTDASYLQIDGRPVAEWLGRHDPHGGRRGEHGGRIQLKPGVHHIDYVQVQFDGPPAAVAAWKRPGQERFEVMSASAFLPVARFRATGFESAPSGPAQLYFEWQTQDHCRLGDALAVRVRLRVVDNGQGRTYRWHFDDGDGAAGPSVQHFFPQAGLREVALQAWDKNACVASNTVRIRVNPNWLQHEDWRPDVFDEAKRDFLRRDLARTPARDLAEILELADLADDPPLLRRAGEMFLQRQEEFSTAAGAVTFYRLGLLFQHQGDEGDRLAEQALRLALAPKRTVPLVNDKAKLRLADLLIQCAGKLDEAEQLLGSVSGNELTADERRLRRLLQGDLLLARGQVEEARRQYVAVGEVPNRAGGRFGVGRAARLEGASISLQRGEFEEAQRALDLLAFDLPLERMSLETGLLRVRLSLKRKEFQRAFTRCQALLHVAEGDPQKSGVLYGLLEAGLALGKTDEAQRALNRLLQEFPYSEAAAQAKDQWAARK